MSDDIKAKDGEVFLVERIFESENFGEVIDEAIKRNLVFDRLGRDRVMKKGKWVSTEKSTEILEVKYFSSPEKNIHYLITKRPEDEKYGLFEYKWAP